MLVIFFTTISFLLINLIFLKKIEPLLKRFLPDIPNYRSLHLSPIPKGGGISFVLMSLFISIFLLLNNGISSMILLPILCFPLAIIGFLDDLYDLRKVIRYFSQVITSLLILLNSEFFSIFNDLNKTNNYIYLITFMIFITSIINFTNFMDGIDGLVSGCMVSAIIFITISQNLPINYWTLIGSLGAFLIYNWYPAKLFMGDVGSTYLGAIYVGICLNSNSYNETVMSLLIIFPLIADAFTCVIRRFFNNQNIFEAHSLHLYQRLCKAGFDHSKVSLIYILLIFINGFFYLYSNMDKLIYLCLIEILLGYYFDQRKAAPFKLN